MAKVIDSEKLRWIFLLHKILRGIPMVLFSTLSCQRVPGILPSELALRNLLGGDCQLTTLSLYAPAGAWNLVEHAFLSRQRLSS